MPPFPTDPTRPSDAGLRAVLADRTTRHTGGPSIDPVLADHLRVIVARVLRTGRGPAALVKWVRRQLAEHPLPAGDPAGLLAARLLTRLLPHSSAAHTVGC